jgi:hypothetical protein
MKNPCDKFSIMVGSKLLIIVLPEKLRVQLFFEFGKKIIF